MKPLIVFVLVVFAGLIQVAEGQVRGIPPSVTSLAPGRAFLPGPSVTSLGPHGWDFGPVLLGNRHFHNGFNNGVFGHNGFGVGAFGRNGFNNGAFGFGGQAWPVFVPIYTPYGVPVYPMMYSEPDPASTDPSANDTSSLYIPDPNYSGAYGVRPPMQPRSQTNSADVHEQPPAVTTMPDQTAEPPSPPEQQPATVLVFKDGRKLEVTNYAIQGATLYNLGENGPRKVALADLDVKKTVSENDNRGVEFKLPQ